MKIYLVGFMGCGKTRLGKAFANQMNYEFVDLDALIESEEEMTISEIFLSKGEEYFREVERGLLWEIQMENDLVISTGGGTPCYFDNMDFILRSGKSVYLRAEPAFLFSRLKDVRDSRPMLRDFDDEELKLFISELLIQRVPFYMRANSHVEAMNCTVEKIRAALETYER